MIRIDHITDPLRFALSMAFSSAADLASSPLGALLTLVPAVTERGPEPTPRGPRARPARRIPQPPAAGTQPSPA